MDNPTPFLPVIIPRPPCCWPAIFGGVNEHLNGVSPFRRLTLKVWQRLDVFCDFAQRAGRRSTWKGNGLVKWTVPRHGYARRMARLLIRTCVAIDKVLEDIRNVVTFDIAAAPDFEGDIS
jgi:hypothetical protein